MSQYETFYPGIYTQREKPCLKAFLAGDDAIRSRGAIGAREIQEGKVTESLPGVFIIHAEEEMVKYCNKKYDPENPLYNDPDYAKKLGFDQLPALPTYAAHDDTYLKPFPAEARDYLLVSGLSHRITFHQPVCVGDTLYLVVDDRHLTDVTPKEGSEFRSLVIQGVGSIYNQRGELVNTVSFSAQENLKSYQNPADMPKDDIFWIAPPWDNEHPIHYYTDEDWEKILDIWQKEHRQGSESLYWEDVPIGFRPADTLDGPVDDSLEPAYRYGMGIGGTRTLKQEIMNPEFRAKMVRDQVDGIYRMPNRTDSYPEYPSYAKVKYGTDLGGGERSVDHPHHTEVPRFIFINFMGRDYVLRHLNNFMGDHGKLVEITWGIMNPESMEAVGYHLPNSSCYVDYLAPVPEKSMSDIKTHGMERDVMWVKSYVFDKYCQDGKHYVKLAWWIDTILGETFEAGQATIQLPSKNGDID
ncbi:MAG: uncharacterized protein H6Q60_250 [Oscillospiraceae bacterium]|nr:uncharacterized protein [Oscillospiraceae bacterium]